MYNLRIKRQQSVDYEVEDGWIRRWVANTFVGGGEIDILDYLLFSQGTYPFAWLSFECKAKEKISIC